MRTEHKAGTASGRRRAPDIEGYKQMFKQIDLKIFEK
jgi:hypothetical protein